jgi:hypothetical protein
MQAHPGLYAIPETSLNNSLALSAGNAAEDNEEDEPMKTPIPMIVMTALALCVTSARAGELNVAGHLNVASNLTAQAVTLGGEMRTN